MSKCKNVRLWLIIVSSLVASVATAEDSIVVDTNGDYVITYRSDGVAGGIARVVWVPSTKIDPKVKWDVKVSESGPAVLVYRYTIKNNRTSRQALGVVRLVASSFASGSQATPKGWGWTKVNDWGRSAGVILGWGDTSTAGLKPGANQHGFGFESNDLPGVGSIEMIGIAPSGQGFPDEGPDELSPIHGKVVDLQTNNFVSRNTAVPRIAVGNPFNAAVALDNLRAHITADIVGIKLIDPIFASQLDRLIQAAANSVRLNNPKGAREQIRDVLKLLRKEHEDMDKDDGDEDADKDDKKSKSALIDRLAARVLDFDLRYLEKRLKNKDDKDD